MKTTNLFRLAFLVLAIMGLSLTGCKKDKNSNPSTESLLSHSLHERKL